MVIIMSRASILANSIAISITSIIAFLASFDLYRLSHIQNIPIISITSPLIFPFLIVIIMISCIFVLVVKDIKRFLGNKVIINNSKVIDDNDYLEDLKNVLIYCMATYFYTYLLVKTNFIIATFLFDAVVMFYICTYKPLIKKIFIVIFASAITIIPIYYVFTKVFYVVLP